MARLARAELVPVERRVLVPVAVDPAAAAAAELVHAVPRGLLQGACAHVILVRVVVPVLPKTRLQQEQQRRP